MFSTLAGAKNRAKQFKSIFDDSGILVPLNRCQHAVARGGGFDNWHHLERSIAQQHPDIDPAAYRRRVLEALPLPCHPPVNAWFANDPSEPSPDDRLPRRWYVDVAPYLLASAAHQRKNPLLRVGSGPGQKLREEIVLGLQLNWGVWNLQPPMLDPETLAMVYEGRIETVFASVATRPGFERELARLVEAGIIVIEPRTVRVVPSNPDAVALQAMDNRAIDARDWLDNDPSQAARALYLALSVVGIRNATSVADALLRHGDKDYLMASGPMRETLSEIAYEGDLEVYSRAMRLFSTLKPDSARGLRDAVPAMILNQYFARRLQLPAAGAMPWINANPDWADRMKSAVAHPGPFVATVDGMAEEIAATR